MRHSRAHEIRVTSHVGHRCTVDLLKNNGTIDPLMPPSEGAAVFFHRSSHSYGFRTKFETDVFKIVQASLPL